MIDLLWKWMRKSKAYKGRKRDLMDGIENKKEKRGVQTEMCRPPVRLGVSAYNDDDEKVVENEVHNEQTKGPEADITHLAVQYLPHTNTTTNCPIWKYLGATTSDENTEQNLKASCDGAGQEGRGRGRKGRKRGYRVWREGKKNKWAS